jgi:hypothetical protein
VCPLTACMQRPTPAAATRLQSADEASGAHLLLHGVKPLQRLLRSGPLCGIVLEAIPQQLLQPWHVQSLQGHLRVLPVPQQQPSDVVQRLASKGRLPRQHVHYRGCPAPQVSGAAHGSPGVKLLWGHVHRGAVAVAGLQGISNGGQQYTTLVQQLLSWVNTKWF